MLIYIIYYSIVGYTVLIIKTIAHTVSHPITGTLFMTDPRGTYTVLSEFHISLFYRAQSPSNP